ncbi:hypothetical protein OIU78_027025 [Salix suchowensis]|nr:hypothetical protein OIU78_027025 [Salix suchowensis]
MDYRERCPLENPSFTNFNLQQQEQKWDDTSILNYGIRIEPPFLEFNQASESEYLLSSTCNNQPKVLDQEDGLNNEALQTSKSLDWDPRTMLNNLSFLEQKIHHLQDLVHLIVGRKGQALGGHDQLVTQQQQLITADLTSIIVQLISTAAGMNCVPQPQHGSGSKAVQPQCVTGSKVSDQCNQMDVTGSFGD